MQKRKDELRDIYQNYSKDFEQDFTPQVARELIEDHMRDLRRSRIMTTVFGIAVILLTVALIFIIIREMMSEYTLDDFSRTREREFVPLYSLPADDAWVLGTHDAEMEPTPGAKPLSAPWVKAAAYQIILGQQALTVNAVDRALEHLDKALEIFPSMTGIHPTMGMLYLQKGNYTTAAVHLEKALKEGENFDSLNNIGATYIALKEYKKAEQYLLRAHELQPENLLAHRNLAVLYRALEQNDKAIQHFEKYIDMQPNDIDTMQTYAFFLAKTGKWREASVLLAVLVQELKDIAPLHFLLAKAYAQTGQKDKAIETLRAGILLIDSGPARELLRSEEFGPIRDTDEFKRILEQVAPKLATTPDHREKK
ncbi:MAG: tetratricopeptide repeat protein [Kiritimatiellales bacterium]